MSRSIPSRASRSVTVLRTMCVFSNILENSSSRHMISSTGMTSTRPHLAGTITPIPLYHTRSSCVIRGRKWLCHTVYDKTKVFFGASYPVTSTAIAMHMHPQQKTAPNNLVGRCRHNHTTITPVHAHQKIPLFYHKTYDTTIYFSRTKTKCFPLLELGVSYAVSYAQLIGANLTFCGTCIYICTTR